MDDKIFENFDDAFDEGLKSVKSLSGRGSGATIINLCQMPKKPSEKKPNTVGKAAIIPVLDKGLHPIHKVGGVISTTVEVENPDFNPDDKDSPEFFWRTYQAIPADSYTCPVTPQEKALIDELYSLAEDYGNTFSQFGASKKDLFFMKAYMIKLNSEVSGSLFTNLEEPVVLQHTSRRFPKAYKDMCDTNDEWGKDWRRKLFLPDGDVTNFAICSTTKEDVGYQVKFELKTDCKTGRSVDLAKVKSWMDFDINTLGIDTTFVDVDRIKEAIKNINAAWDRSEAESGAALDKGISSATAGVGETPVAEDGVLVL